MALPSSPITRNHAPDLYERGIRKVYMDEELIGRQFDTLWNRISSEKRQEKEVVRAGSGLFHEIFEGNAPDMDVIAEAYMVTVVHRGMGLGFEITQWAMDDELYGIYQDMGQSLGESARQTQEVQAAAPFNDLTSPIYTAGGTNYPVLSTTHFRLDGDTWSNRPTTAVDLSLDSLEAGLAQWRTGQVNQRGFKLAVQPELLVVGPSDESLAKRLVYSMQRPGGNDNDLNFVKQYRNLQVFVWDFLTDDGRWFLMAPKKNRAMNWFDRQQNRLYRSDDPHTGNMRLTGRYRSQVMIAKPQGIFGSP